MLRKTSSFFLLIACLVVGSPLYASWKPFGLGPVAAVDFWNAHEGVLSFADATHLIQTLEHDSVLSGVFQAPNVVTGIVIQDSGTAWATIKGNGLYIGTKHWSNWSQTSSQSGLTLVGATPQRVFLYSLGQFYYTLNGTNLIAVDGVPKGDSITAIDYFSDDMILAASATTIYRSTDAGSTWNVVLTGIRNCNSLFVDRVNKLAYTGSDTLRKSTNNGVTWQSFDVPAPFSWKRTWGRITGSHDCSGVFYLTDTTYTDYNIIRSEDGGKTFEDVGGIPPLTGDIERFWTFDRGSVIWWWSRSSFGGPNLAVSHDGANGAISDSVYSNVTVSIDTLFDTACGAIKQSFRIHIASSICTGVQIDSIIPISSSGTVLKAAIARTLFGDTASAVLSYTSTQLGVDTITLRLLFHSLEWKLREHLDVRAYAIVATRPAIFPPIPDVDFGTVRTDSAKDLTIDIRNSGCTPLRVDSIVSTDPNVFQISSPTTPLQIRSDSIVHIPIRFSPHRGGLAVEAVEIGTSAGHQFVTVQGEGRLTQSSVEADSQTTQLHIFPNPAATFVHLSNDQYLPLEITILDALGRNVWSSVITDARMDVSQLPEGFYMLSAAGRTTPLLIARP